MTVRARYQNLKTVAAVTLGCVLFTAQAQTQPAAPATSATEQFVLKSDGTLVPVAEPKASPRTAPPIPAPAATGGTPSSGTSRVASAPPVSSSGTIADSDSTSAAQAVAAARQALNSKQFAQLASFVPKARGDVLAIYPE